MAAAVIPTSLPPVQEGKILDIARPTVIQQKRKKTPRLERIPVHERRYKGANVQTRPGLAEHYEKNLSGKESWWRTYIRETPLPGSYEIQKSDTFLLDLQKSINTYNFKCDGRRRDAHSGGKGADLLPGEYNFKDIVELLPHQTYSFKSAGRKGDILNEGIKDKDINVAPNQYETQKYNCVSVVDPNNKNFTFKSTSKRFPTVYFTPKEGPAPGQYNARSNVYTPIVSSSFKSATPRFKTSHTKVPGPGMYEPTFQSPQTKTIENMGRNHGLFFACSFLK